MLFDLENDPVEIHDLAALHPEIVAQLVVEFDLQAGTNYVYPIDNRNESRNTTFPPYELDRLLVPRDFFRTSQSIPGLVITPMVGDRSYVIRADFDWKSENTGVIFALGDRFCGLTLFVRSGALYFVYQWWHSPKSLAPIKLVEGPQIFEFRYKAIGERKGIANVTLNGVICFVDLDLSPTLLRIPNSGLSVGVSRRTAVSEQYEDMGSFEYSGHIDRIRIEPGDIAPKSPEEISEETYQSKLRDSLDKLER